MKKENSQFSKKRVLITTFGMIAVVVALTIIVTMLTQPAVKNKTEKPSLEIASFKSYDEIEKVLDKMGVGTVLDDVIAKTDGLTGDASFNNTFAQTYKQIDDVDEPDIIKNNGKAIFYADKEMGVRIYSAKNGECKEINTITDNTDNTEVVDIFANATTLVINSVSYADTTTITSVYDIRKIDGIKLMSKHVQSGIYTSSRMIDDDLFVVSRQDIRTSKDLPKATQKDGKQENLSPSDICSVAVPSVSEYAVISRIDTKKATNNATTKAVLGGSSDVYCTDDNMYITANIINIEKKASEETTRAATIDEIDKQNLINRQETEIIKVDIKNDIKFVATARVPGYINNQYSLDEKNDKLRVATTSMNKSAQDTNNIFILNENMKQIGSVEEFAPNESIKAVKYIDDTAYVITYKETDPLFVIDLTDSKKPAILGECKLDGFSTMLVPAGQNRLLGIGFDAVTEAGVTKTDGMKLALFDITDKKSPKVIDEYSLKDYNSAVQYDAKALVYNSDNNTYFAPYSVAEFNKAGYWTKECGAIGFDVKNDKIAKPKHYKSTDVKMEQDCVRVTYIGDYVYMINSDGSIHSEKM